jgi:hypothetical protein
MLNKRFNRKFFKNGNISPLSPSPTQFSRNLSAPNYMLSTYMVNFAPPPTPYRHVQQPSYHYCERITSIKGSGIFPLFCNIYIKKEDFGG